MLEITGTRLPHLPLVRASALRLPFKDATLAGINCSNSLQLIPDPHIAIAEAGRCLRPGGVCTMFTFRQAPDPDDRYFQLQHAQAFNVQAFRPEDLAAWLNAAGLDLVHLARPARRAPAAGQPERRDNMLLFTALRRP